MRLKRPFLKLGLRFDADAIAAEVRALPPEAWTPHPTGYVGNEAVRLITPGGRPTDEIEGVMEPTQWLGAMPYVRQIMGEIGAVWGRSRLMGLAAGREVPEHIDINYYWRTHHRIHIPVITNPGVEFTCGDETVHMAAGECWAFDSFRWHNVQNRGSAQRIHLVIDTVGGGILPDLMAAAENGSRAEGRLVPPDPDRDKPLRFERTNAPAVMSPWEMRCHLAFVTEQARGDKTVEACLAPMRELLDKWSVAWAEYGESVAGVPTYVRLLDEAYRATVGRMPANLALPDGPRVSEALGGLIFSVALSANVRKPDVAPVTIVEEQPTPLPDTSFRKRIDRPILIVSTPRSGSTLLYETLENAPDLFSVGNESHWLIEDVPGLSPQERGWSSNRLTADDATAERAEHLSRAFYQPLSDRDGKSPRGTVRMLEKTPKNSLRSLFFDAMWRDAHFIYLYRDVRQTLNSMIEAWSTGHFATYPQLPGWRGPPWSLLLVPGWQRLNGLSLPEIVAHQWAITTENLLDDLETLERERVHVIDHSSFLTDPQVEISRLTEECGLGWDRQLGPTLPLSKTTVSAPNPDKWRRIEPVIQSIFPIVEKADLRARAFVAERLGQGTSHQSGAIAAAS